MEHTIQLFNRSAKRRGNVHFQKRMGGFLLLDKWGVWCLCGCSWCVVVDYSLMMWNDWHADQASLSSGYGVGSLRSYHTNGPWRRRSWNRHYITCNILDKCLTKWIHRAWVAWWSPNGILIFFKRPETFTILINNNLTFATKLPRFERVKLIGFCSLSPKGNFCDINP